MPSITPPSLWDNDEIPEQEDDRNPFTQRVVYEPPESDDPRDTESVASSALDNLPLDFGKHRGKTPTQLLKTDPGYIVWIRENTERLCFSEETYQRAKQLVKALPPRR